MSLKIIRDENFDGVNVHKINLLPLINSNDLPPPQINGLGSAIAYDIITKQVYYSDGITWLPINNNTGPGTISSYSFIKDGVLSVPSNSATIIKPWSITPSPPYSTLGDWNLTTGVFTSSIIQKVNISAVVTWSSGFSNLGNRTIRLVFFNSSNSTTNTVQQVTIQANPDANENTVQYLNMVVLMHQNDRVWIECQQNSGIPLQIDSGVNTTVAGFINPI